MFKQIATFVDNCINILTREQQAIIQSKYTKQSYI